MDPRVLLIHPYNHMEADAVPVGTVGLVNLLPQKALGRFASEVTPDDVRAARVVLIDVHWFFPLGVLAGIAGAIRRINPVAKIIVGGLASAFYADVFLERYPVDFVIRGDVEPVFSRLVSHLLAGDEPPPLANVWSKRGPPPAMERIRVPDFDAIDWLTIDWFPAYRKLVYERHAMYRARLGASAPLCYPYLPVTRGCRRACEFCYGAYHERVFGRGIRMRAPEVLLRDLERIEADPGLTFVSILFADEGLMEPYAETLANRRLAMDAFLFFCGNARSAVLDAVRSGFSGVVNFSIIQAADLAPLPSDPPGQELVSAHRALVEHFEGMTRTGAVFYYVNHPPSAEVASLAAPGSAITFDSGKDWEVLRPDSTAFRAEDGYGAREQLADVESAARSAAGWHVARLLVPTVRDLLDSSHYRFDLRDGAADDDPIALRIAAEYRVSLKNHGVYGFRALELQLHAAILPGTTPTAWVRPVRRHGGSCAWTAGLSGFGWEGVATVDETGPDALAPCPVLLAWEGPPIDLAHWPKTLVPGVAVPRGPPRTVRFGGETTGPLLTLWVEDRGTRSEHRLPHGLGLVEAEGVVVDRTHLRGRDVTPDCQRNLWPAPSWPRAVRDAVLARATRQLSPVLRPTYFRLEPTHVDVELSGDHALSVAVVVFPRDSRARERHRGSERLAFALRVRTGNADMAPLQALFESVLRRAEAIIEADPVVVPGASGGAVEVIERTARR